MMALLLSDSLTAFTADGWSPTWTWPVLATVIVIAFVITLLVFFMIVSFFKQIVSCYSGWIV
jgi:hypothetical protein